MSEQTPAQLCRQASLRLHKMAPITSNATYRECLQGLAIWLSGQDDGDGIEGAAWAFARTMLTEITVEDELNQRAKAYVSAILDINSAYGYEPTATAEEIEAAVQSVLKASRAVNPAQAEQHPVETEKDIEQRYVELNWRLITLRSALALMAADWRGRPSTPEHRTIYATCSTALRDVLAANLDAKLAGPVAPAPELTDEEKALADSLRESVTMDPDDPATVPQALFERSTTIANEALDDLDQAKVYLAHIQLALGGTAEMTQDEILTEIVRLREGAEHRAITEGDFALQEAEATKRGIPVDDDAFTELPVMTVRQIAMIGHRTKGSIAGVSYHPDGCDTCDRARDLARIMAGLPEVVWPDGTSLDDKS